jgi:hypothetical protein
MKTPSYMDLHSSPHPTWPTPNETFFLQMQTDRSLLLIINDLKNELISVAFHYIQILFIRSNAAN